MELKATVIDVLPIERGVSKAGKEWEKATIIAEYGDEKYPKRVAISTMRDAVKFTEVPVGAEVTFSIDIESREFNGRWYTSVNCWKWEVASANQVQPSPSEHPEPPADNDIPF